MQLFIAVTVLVTATAAYLLHQFWRRSLVMPGQDEAGAEGPDDELRAA
ncbi:MAG TPA: hypothetical protein VFY79_13960 [Dehalococcoidia bacterium]|jgi:hypothetical protein|nr:hypothetical protein [Dehalococcoidia bacterium]